jgi:recombination protein RecT
MAIENLKQLFEGLTNIRAEWEGLRANTRLNFGAELEWFMQACEKSDYAKDAAIGNLDATFAAFRNIAAIGVTLDPARKLAYIVPRDKKLVYDLSYMGLIDIAITAGAIAWAQARMVYANDEFTLSGFDSPPTHKCKPFAKPEARGEVLGAYVVVKTAGGDYLTNTMHIDEINAIRDRSPAWKRRDPKKPGSGGPWETDPQEMDKKTVVKNAYKYWPRSEALDRAIHYLNTDGAQGIDLTPEDEAKTAASIADAHIAEVKKATSGTAVATAWHNARQDENLKANPEAYGKVREAVAARNRELGVQPPTATPTPAPYPTPTPTPSPAPAPATRQAAAQSPFAKVMAAISAARTYETLEATGPAIDALGPDEINEANDAYNIRLNILKEHDGNAPEGV